MPITLVSKKITVDYALALCYARLPNIIRPAGLFKRAIEKFDAEDRKFNDAEDIAAAVGAYISNHATDIQIDLDHFAETSRPFAQFKRVMIGRVGPMNVALLEVKGGTSASLADEAAMLKSLKDRGLRTVPVYDSPEKVAQTGRMAQKAVVGNFLDCKERFTEKQNLNIVAALFGIPGINREADAIAPIKKKIEEKMALKQYPSNITQCIDKALKDFKKIQEYLSKFFISDLQGIIEFGTGKFYIIDPLKLGSIDDALPSEKECVLYVNHVIGLLEQLKSHFGNPGK